MSIPVPLSCPSAWRQVPARRLFVRKRRAPSPTDEVVTAFRDGQVVARSKRRTEGFTNAIKEIGYQGVRRGDLVIHSMDGFAGAIGVSESDGKASPVVHVYAAGNDVDARFVAYVLRALAGQGFITSLAKGIRERSTAFDPESFASLTLPVPPLEEQRILADYLDRETARIDALIAAKRRLQGLHEERWQAYLDLTMDELWDRSEARPIQTLCSLVVDCVNRTAPIADEPTPFKMIRTSNVRNGLVDLADTNFVDPDVFAHWNRRATPSRGDIVLTREAPAGEVGLLESDEPVFLGQRLMLFRPDLLRSDPDFLRFSLLTTRSKDSIALMAAGSLHEHLRVREAARIQVPSPNVERQVEIGNALRDRFLTKIKARELLEKSVGLLQERRHSVVDAAIAGRFDPSELR